MVNAKADATAFATLCTLISTILCDPPSLSTLLTADLSPRSSRVPQTSRVARLELTPMVVNMRDRTVIAHDTLLRDAADCARRCQGTIGALTDPIVLCVQRCA